MTLGIFGGTFDPIHTGHLIVARAALETLGLDEALFVPAGKPWMKAGEDVSPAEDRARMAELAVAGEPQFRVSRMEIERPGETYTLDTLRALPAGDGRPVLLLGADAFANFAAWREPAEVARLVRIAVLGRPGRDTAAIIDEVKAEVPNVDAAPLEAPLIEISATAIRDRVRRGLPIRDLVPPAVAGYIADRGLYRSDGQPSADSRRNRLKEIIEARAVMRGSFTLASGKTSSYYFDGRRATHDPEGAGLIGELVAELLDPGIEAIGGPATAANPIITATQIAAARAGRPIDAFYVRSQTKEHGTKKLVEGNLPAPVAEVVIVDDTMTTGGSLRHAIEAVEAEGCRVARVLVVVDRGEGGADALRARGYEVSALFHADAEGNLT